jgi:glycosyltransferase involved in cell wall biosynthesis
MSERAGQIKPRGRRILFATTVLPGERRGGGEITSYRFIDALRNLGHDVTVLGYGRPQYALAEGECLVQRRPIETKTAPVHAIGWAILAWLTRRAFSAQKYVGRTYRDVLIQHLQQESWDAVIVDHGQLAWLLPYLKRQKCIHVCHNNEASLYVAHAAAAFGLPRMILQREAVHIRLQEVALARSCDAVWTLTRGDAEYFSSLGARSVTSFPVPSAKLPPDFELPQPSADVALLGSWTWKPNRAGLDWFCAEVVPRLPSSLTIRIAGQGADDLMHRYANVHVFGRVPDAARFLAEARCIAIPSTQGAGIQIKTLDAIAVGRPVVATSLALRGIDAPLSRIDVVDDAKAFADAIITRVSGALPVADNAWSHNREIQFYASIERALDAFFQVGAARAAS